MTKGRPDPLGFVVASMVWPESYAGQLLRQYEQEHAMTVPIRGTVHDIGPSVSHKAEVIRRYLRGQSPADIARNLTTRSTP
ncbi:DUF1670 domain-containing protein [Candidatus Amarolinea dominans]|uniref:DUF1670 domain-containing protein n=1 Tax=Candidatus Amarolinea dominans TaxID=3140696 RepID=UPI0031CC6544